MDEWLGRLMDVVPDDVFMFVLGDTGIALGEHDYAGRGTPTSHRLSYEIPYLIRHPRGEKAGDDIDWYAIHARRRARRSCRRWASRSPARCAART